MNFDQLREIASRQYLGGLENYESVPKEIRGFPLWLLFAVATGEDRFYRRYMIQQDPGDHIMRREWNYEAYAVEFAYPGGSCLVWVCEQDDHRVLQAKYFVAADLELQRAIRQGFTVFRRP